MGLWHFLVTSLENPEDDFQTRLRKAIIGVLFFPGSIANLLYSLRGFTIYTSPSHVAACFTIFLVGVAYIASYIWMRWKRTVTGTHMAATLWSYAVLNAVPILAFPEFDFKTAIFAMQALGVMSEMPGLMFYLIFTTCQMFVVDWNAGSRQYPEKMWTLPDPRIGTEQLAQVIGFWVGTLLMMAMLKMFYGQVVESNRRGAAQTAANDMTFRVLMCHRRYNTDAVSAILEQCTEEQVVDPELIELFRGMNGNLESYRPFLPNYLFQDSDTGDDDDKGEEGDEEDSEGGIIYEEEEDGVTSSAAAKKSRSSSQASGHHPRPNNIFDEQSSRRGGVALVPSGSVTSGALNKRGVLFTGRITFALVDLCGHRLRSEGTEVPEAQVFQMVVDSIYSLAKETKASVHSMLGDTVQLTWNATSNIALPETKGAIFLARLADKFTGRAKKEKEQGASKGQETLTADIRRSSMTISGAVCSGTATIHNITSNHQQALIIEAPWLPSLEGIFDLAKQHAAEARRRSGGSHADSQAGVVLMDEVTQQASRMEVESLPVEQVSYVPTTAKLATSAGPSPLPKYSFLAHYPEKVVGAATPVPPVAVETTRSLVYQILGEKVRADDEWMYQLQNDHSEAANGTHQNKAAALQLSAIICLADGHYGEAAARLEAAGEHQAAAVGSVKARSQQPHSSTTAIQEKGATKAATPILPTSREVALGSAFFTEWLASKCERELLKSTPDQEQQQK